MQIFLHFMSGLHFLVVGNTPHDISANATQRIKPDLSSLVNKAYKAFLLAQSKLNKINNALDNDLEEILVEEKMPMTRLEKLR